MTQKVTINLRTGAAPRVPTVATSVRRPVHLTSRTSQLVILNRDSSPSMEGRKATDASSACADLVGELASPENRDGFIVAVVDFADGATLVNRPTSAGDLGSRLAPIDTDRGSGTNIADGLRASLHVVRQHQSSADGQRFHLRPVAILFSDGQANVGGDPGAAAVDLKQVADVVAVAFGSDADEAALKALASSPQHFYRCRNGRELRAFLAQVGRTLTGTMQRGTNATLALSQLGRQ